MNQNTASVIKIDLIAAIHGVNQKHGTNFTITDFTSDNRSITLKLRAVRDDLAEQKVIDFYNKAWSQGLGQLDMNRVMINAKGEYLYITGLKPSRPKYPLCLSKWHPVNGTSERGIKCTVDYFLHYRVDVWLVNERPTSVPPTIEELYPYNNIPA